MSDLEAVKICRSIQEDIRQRADELELLNKSREQLPEAEAVMAQAIARCQNELDGLRRELPVMVSRCIRILDGVPYKERRVLMLYYVSGATLREVAQTLKCGIRTVQKLKKAGLDRLR
ncbi:MAG: hypothetical protein IJ461_00050 [Clostridia bacterium]|nr:hypothetical protein [Clostridia bacterium]